MVRRRIVPHRVKFSPFSIARALALVVIATCNVTMAAPAVLTVRIDPAQRFQTVRGFGASGAWWPNYIADLPEVILSPINEPQWFWGRDRRHQEGCHYTPAELAATMKELVLEKRRRGMKIEIQGPESADWKSADGYARAMFDVPEIREEVRSFAVHSFWSTPEERRKSVEWFRVHYPDKVLEMTEYCQMERGHGTGMDEALHMAGVMHEDLVVGNVESWQWWLAIFSGNYNDALIYAHLRSRSIETTKRLWAMGNFSRFVRPGATRVAAVTPDGLRVSAYQSADDAKTAVILINEGGEKTILPELANGRIGAMEMFVTSEEHDLAPMPVADAQSIKLPARSITTLIILKAR